MSIVHNFPPAVQAVPAIPAPAPLWLKPSRIPYARMAQVRRLLATHATQLHDHGHAGYVIQRCEIGRPQNFLRSVRALVGPGHTVTWWEPWVRGAPSNVLIVTRV